MSDISSVLKRITETIALSALYHLDAMELYLEDDECYFQFLTTKDVAKLENISILLSDDMFFEGWEKDHIPYFVKARYEEIEGKYNERVVGFYCSWIEGNYNMFIAKLFCDETHEVSYKWLSDVSKAKKTSYTTQDIFGDVDWKEIVYAQ